MKPIHSRGRPSLTNAKMMARLAMRAISDELETMLREEVGRIAARHPDKVVMAMSAMGTWFVHLEEPDDPNNYRELNPGVLKAFESAQEEFGWNAIPAPLQFIGRGDSVLRVTGRDLPEEGEDAEDAPPIAPDDEF